MELRYEGSEWFLDMEDCKQAYDLYDHTTCIALQHTGSLRFPCVQKEARPAFTLVMKPHRYVLKQRYLSQIGVVNFRDIGGYVNREGRQVRYDCFYRSAPLCDLNTEQIAYINALQLAHILDLRSEGEANGKPDITFPHTAYHQIPGIPMMRDSMLKGNLDFSALMKKLDLSMLKGMMSSVYEMLPFANPAYRFLIDVVKKEEVPIVLHCSAGKDRTGFGAALILLLLGVEEDVIIQDYLLSNVYRREENAKIFQSLQKDEEDMQALMGVKKEYLEASLNAIKTRYGSYDTYFLEEYGIDAQQRKLLQERYLYPLNM